MKKGTNSKVQTKTTPKPIFKSKNPVFPNITNEQALRRSLRLLGVTDETFQKQTKSSLNGDFFAKSQGTPTNSKQFFFIAHLCIKSLASSQQTSELAVWYPPRSVNEQIQFKKIFFKILQKLQAQATIPKNIILSKMVIMSDTNPSTLVQFLRILTQLSLRAVYIDKYSKTQRLIQIAVNNNSSNLAENDINKFYLFPFNQTATSVEPPIKSQAELNSLKQIFRIYIERYRKKILSLRTVQETQGINPQKLMSQIVQQKQLSETLSTKVNKSIYSQNRAFDRRIILQKNAQIWKQLSSLPYNFIQEQQSSVLKVQGETAKLLSNWRPIKGTHTLIEFNKNCQKIKELKKKCQQKINQLNSLRSKILTLIKK